VLNWGVKVILYLHWIRFDVNAYLRCRQFQLIIADKENDETMRPLCEIGESGIRI